MITDTFSFLNDLRTLNLNTDNVFMASFDISSLFTNVSLDETIEIIIQKLFHNSTHYLGYSHVLILMGSPLGPLFANIFLLYHEKNWLDNCPPLF